MKKIILFTIYVLLVSCADKNIGKDTKFNFAKKDSVNIRLDNATSLSPIYWNIIEESSQSYFINVGGGPFSLSKINIFTSNVEKVQYFEEIGSDAYGGNTGFYYHNKDSIFILNGYSNKFGLFNGESKKINSYSINDNFSITASLDRKATLYDNDLYIQGTEYLRLDHPEFANKARILLKIDLQTGEQQKIINYPDEYKDKVWKSEYLDTYNVLVNSNIYVSFGKSHFIYKYDLDGNLISKFNAKSKYVKNAKPLNNRDNNSPKEFDILYENGYYTKILYDKYKKVFYRFCFSLLPSRTSVKKKDLSDLKLSVIVLDENLVYLNEFPLQSEISGWYSFINKKGLFLNLKPFHLEDCIDDEECVKFYGYY